MNVCTGLLGVQNIELLQRCRPRVRTALAIDVIRLGPHRDLRKIRQRFSRATPRSTGAHVAASARVEGLLFECEFLQGLVFDADAHPSPGALVGAVGQDGDALALANADDPVDAAAVRS